MRRPAAAASPIVIKVGSSSLTHGGDGIDPAALRRVVGQVVAARQLGHRVVLVTSGAVAAGLPAMGLSERPPDLPSLQVAAAVGQSRLMHSYAEEFDSAGITTGQVLLTRDVLADREQYLHAREALARMLALDIVPIVNENDTVVVDELRFGDNDRLAAIVAHLVAAGMLVILSDTAGLFSDDPRLGDDAEILSAVRHTDEILDEIRGSSGTFGSGGVATKVSAARMAAWSGIPTVVADATSEGVVVAAIGGEDIGTWIEPHESGLSSKKLWIAFGLPAHGRLVIDRGAIEALANRGASLLAVGISEIRGDFEAGSAVEVLDESGDLIAKGRAGFGAHELRAGFSEASIVIHRDDLVVFV